MSASTTHRVLMCRCPLCGHGREIAAPVTLRVRGRLLPEDATVDLDGVTEILGQDGPEPQEVWCAKHPEERIEVAWRTAWAYPEDAASPVGRTESDETDERARLTTREAELVPMVPPDVAIRLVRLAEELIDIVDDESPIGHKVAVRFSERLSPLRDAVGAHADGTAPATESTTETATGEVERLRDLLKRAAALFPLPPTGCAELPSWAYEIRMDVARELGQDTTWLEQYAPAAPATPEGTDAA